MSRLLQAPKLLIPDVKSPKLKIKHSSIMKILKANIVKAKNSLKNQKSLNEERLETLVSVEKEYIHSLINVRKKKIIFDEILDTSPNTKIKNTDRREKKPRRNLSHSRKSSLKRRCDTTCSSPKSDWISKILHG
jgi:hypothetical protein